MCRGMPLHGRLIDRGPSVRRQAGHPVLRHGRVMADMKTVPAPPENFQAPIPTDPIMLIQPIDVFVNAWLGIAVLSAAYMAWGEFRGNPEPAVMKWGFVLITLYMGPIGLLLYVMADKEPAPGTHETFVHPFLETGCGLGRALRCRRHNRLDVLDANGHSLPMPPQ